MINKIYNKVRSATGYEAIKAPSCGTQAYYPTYKKWVVKKELRGEHGQREYEQYTSEDEESEAEGETNISNSSENVYSHTLLSTLY